jgi:hypothetical protein
MSKRPKSFWRTCRVYFRRFRIAVWFAILMSLVALLYLNQIGLPDFAKKPLVEKLRARGLDLRFSRLRLSWFRGLVAENARFGRPDEPLSPHLTVREVQLRFNHQALARLQFQIDALVLRHGRLVWPIVETNGPQRELALEDIQSHLRFLPDDLWALDQFTARFAGVNFELSAIVTNASAIRDWKVFQPRPAGPAGATRPDLRKLADTLERIHFSESPEIRLDVRGDAREPTSFTVRTVLNAPGADTPWGELAGGRLTARLYPATTNGLSRADLILDADNAQTRWGRTANLQLTAHLASYIAQTNLAQGDLNLCADRAEAEWGSGRNLQVRLHFDSIPGQTNLVNAELAAQVEQIETRWGSSTSNRLNARWIHALTNPIPLAGEGQYSSENASSQWGAAKAVRFNAHFANPATEAPPSAPDPSLGLWAKLEPYVADWDCQFLEPHSPDARAEEITCTGSWNAPELTVRSLQARLGQKALQARGELEVASRALQLQLTSDIDPHWIEPLFTKEMRGWLAKCSWELPPEFKVEAFLTVPPWVDPGTNWPETMLASLQMAGEFNFANGGAFEAVSFTSARSHFTCTNLFVALPDLRVTRPEGWIEAALSADQPSQDFQVHLRSTVDPNFLRPLFPSREQKGFEYFTFTQPPDLDLEVHGQGQDPERLGVKGHVALTNFTFRGESVAGLQTDVEYTNRFLLFSNPRLQRTVGEMSADAVAADFVGQKVYLTNGISTTDPMFVARAIGPHVARAIEPYRFQKPPVAHVRGIVPMHGEEDADLEFDLDGGPFNWWRFTVPHITGNVHWRGLQLDLKNIRMAFYGGEGSGFARFNFHSGRETDYQFALIATNTALQPLLRDLFARTNHVEGTLSGSLIIAQANTLSLQSWYGYGNLDLRDGLLWEIPIFGVFSDVLNGLSPGLGSSRASAGTCNFSITNGIIHSDDLDIRSTGMRLQYRGTVDFDGRVKARVEAGLLKDMWLVGPVVSTVFWPVTKLFEYKVSGTLGEPKAEPVFIIPKMLFLPFQMPFHPLRTLKGLLPEGSSNTNTNHPVLNPPKSNE